MMHTKDRAKAAPVQVAKPEQQVGHSCWARTSFQTLVRVTLVGILGYLILAHHFVMTSDGLKVYRKGKLTLQDTYVDATRMSFLELPNHIPLARTMILQGGLQYLPAGTEFQTLSRAASRALDRLP